MWGDLLSNNSQSTLACSLHCHKSYIKNAAIWPKAAVVDPGQPRRRTGPVPASSRWPKPAVVDLGQPRCVCLPQPCLRPAFTRGRGPGPACVLDRFGRREPRFSVRNMAPKAKAEPSLASMRLTQVEFNPGGEAPDLTTVPNSWAEWCEQNLIYAKRDQDIGADLVRRFLADDYEVAAQSARASPPAERICPLCMAVWVNSEYPGFPVLFRLLILATKEYEDEHVMSPQAYDRYVREHLQARREACMQRSLEQFEEYVAAMTETEPEG